MNEPVTIIIPARSEEGIIIRTLSRLQQCVTPVRILVISDRVSAEDRTEHIVSDYIKKHKQIVLHSKTVRQDKDGFASALMRGIRASKTPYVVFVMADNCDDPATIDRMYKKIREGWDVVAGSRYMKGGKKSGGPVLQGVFSQLVNSALYILTGIPTHDSSNSFKMYRREVLNSLVLNNHSGVEVSLSMILQAYFNGAKITEIPTSWAGRTQGNSKFYLLNQLPLYAGIILWALQKRWVKRGLPSRV